ncbi:MAG: diguanylate cyclase, partial [Eubacteriales bacterium]|nr:diguanylate cyclase [Eubacteriales bacterium]
WMLKRFSIECEGIPDVQLLGSFKSPLKALDFAKENRVELAFLDVEMPGMNGLELASKLREITPELIVIFVSAYESYMAEAFKSKTADYYIMKPYDHGDVEAAIDRARLLSGRLRKQVFARTFGAFELFVDSQPVAFPDDKTKEMLALLVDRRGGVLSAKDMCPALWPDEAADEATAIRCRQAFKRLQDALKAARLHGIADRNEQGAFVHTDVMDCDLFQYLDGDLKTMRQFSGEYMTGYAWAEESRRKLATQNQLLGRYSDAQTRNTLCASIRCLSDEPMTLTYVNEGFLAVVGYTREEISEKFNNSLRAMIVREDFDNAVARGKELLLAGAPLEVEYRLRNKNGDEIWVLGKSEQPRKIEDGLYESACILIDIFGLKAEQGHLERAAQRDGLTGLYNRASGQEKIRQFLASDSARVGALILMDVDNFKAVNDTYGHPFADTVLTDIAAILTRSFRASDIVCRLGGDEMMIFLKDVGSEATARAKLQSAQAALCERLRVKTERGELSCSFGGVLSPDDGSNFETLYQRADLALYCAKEQKNCAVWFPDVRMRMVDKLIAREVTAIDPPALDASPDETPCALTPSGDLPEAILRALTEIGRKYDISRAYVFEMADDQPMAVNTFEWCAFHAAPEIENLQALPAEAPSAQYEALFAGDGLLYCYDIRTLSAELYGILEPQGIKSVLQCVLTCDGHMLGMVGFDECRERRYWNGRQIKALSDFAKALSRALHAYRQTHGQTLAALQKDARGFHEENEKSEKA